MDDLVQAHIEQANWHFQRAIELVAQRHGILYAVRYCLTLLDQCMAQTATRRRLSRKGKRP